MKLFELMKSFFFILFTSILLSGCLKFSEDSTQTKIKQAVDSINIIDTHEHLMSEKSRLGFTTDIFYLFKNYPRHDLISAGLQKKDEEYIFNDKNPLEERWNKFDPYWKKTRNTAYSQVILIAAKNLFGVDDLNENTYKKLNKKVVESNHKGWYSYVLKEKSGIDISILDPPDVYLELDSIINEEFFVRVKRFDNFIRFPINKINYIEEQTNEKIETLDDYLNALDIEFQNAIKVDKIVGIKSALAYRRSLFHEDIPRPEAEKIFNKILSSEKLDPEELKKIEDFMMFRVIGKAEEYNLPIQIHTGILAGNNRSNPIENTNATLLINLFLKFPKARFVIFHGSYPYMAELGVLAKNFPNVYIDMCWMYIISPEASRTYLEEWLLTVPSSKIMAFGGDMSASVEGVYGHVVIARKIITEVLTGMVEKEYYTEQEAIKIAKMILRENAIEVYNLETFLD